MGDGGNGFSTAGRYVAASRSHRAFGRSTAHLTAVALTPSARSSCHQRVAVASRLDRRGKSGSARAAHELAASRERPRRRPSLPQRPPGTARRAAIDAHDEIGRARQRQRHRSASEPPVSPARPGATARTRPRRPRAEPHRAPAVLAPSRAPASISAENGAAGEVTSSIFDAAGQRNWRWRATVTTRHATASRSRTTRPAAAVLPRAARAGDQHVEPAARAEAQADRRPADRAARWPPAARASPRRARRAEVRPAQAGAIGRARKIRTKRSSRRAARKSPCRSAGRPTSRSSSSSRCASSRKASGSLQRAVAVDEHRRRAIDEDRAHRAVGPQPVDQAEAHDLAERRVTSRSRVAAGSSPPCSPATEFIASSTAAPRACRSRETSRPLTSSSASSCSNGAISRCPKSICGASPSRSATAAARAPCRARRCRRRRGIARPRRFGRLAVERRRGSGSAGTFVTGASGIFGCRRGAVERQQLGDQPAQFVAGQGDAAGPEVVVEQLAQLIGDLGRPAGPSTPRTASSRSRQKERQVACISRPRLASPRSGKIWSRRAHLAGPAFRRRVAPGAQGIGVAVRPSPPLKAVIARPGRWHPRSALRACTHTRQEPVIL